MSMPVIEPGTVTRCQAINDLMESIALQETGLSHIINAEGEKIQAALALEHICFEDLLAINESVKETLFAIKDFEQILHDKLDLLIGQ